MRTGTNTKGNGRHVCWATLTALCTGAKKQEEKENGIESSEMSGETNFKFPNPLYMAKKKEKRIGC